MKKRPLKRNPPKLKPPAFYKNSGLYMHRVMVGTPTLGVVRIEWHNAVNGLVIPCNWSNSIQTPVGFLVADAQNIICHEALKNGFEWVLLLEDDVIPPPNLFLVLAEWMEKKTVPIISGLYHLKRSREPLIYRGRGNGAFRKWKPGDEIWVDGVPTGCLLIHTSILRVLAEEAPDYVVQSGGQKFTIRQVFKTPRSAHIDPSTGAYQKLVGTSDLDMSDRIIEGKVLKRAGWTAIADRKYPYLCLTALRCGHIDRDTGEVF